jgi:SAM-dependent methyltransferase
MANDEQSRLWNGPSGANWVAAQVLLDEMFRPFEELLARAVMAAKARRVLDVGCGTGATTLAAARATGGGCGTGIDISQPLIARARERAARESVNAEFIVADAQTHDFAGAGHDMLISRFGVMFFDDPVQAFGNLRSAVRESAPLRCLAFRSLAENPFMTAAERAAAPLLPDLPPRPMDGPGQFAFADARKVQGILEAAGWRDVEMLPIDVTCEFPESALQGYMARLGPVALALRGADDDLRGRVMQAMRAAFASYLHGGEVRFTAACWEIAARA